ncbi:HAMP domain-containing sensor histidine kinase [Streptomyces sp. AK02-01A]|uniref:sensor histidine kinase n=1 Tax=Streptomyces sp. AK02-01A TaxID=3028648 RepID=UPI0029B58733|nr:HAMP domain-containing sensor histidine kinase [Streptomyces sp. AK02-01A]MDX3855690.1 HAMP domain-containing sensor histidine kinase [Streptomyces sp. AK02-01A]
MRSSTESEQRETLSRQAKVWADTPRLSLPLLHRQQRIAGFNGIRLALVPPSGPVTGGSAPAVSGRTAAALRAGHQVSLTGQLDGEDVLLEGAPTAVGGGIVLTQPFTTVDQATDHTRRVLLLPTAIGLVSATLAGGLLARHITRPVKRAASSARRLARGERGVIVEPGRHREIADLAEALTTLDTGLRRSEKRQHDFLTSVSHELRTPLTAILGYAEALAEGVVDQDDTAPVGTVVLAEAQRLEHFIQDLLDLARLDADDFRLNVQRIDLDALFEEAARTWFVRCEGKGVRFRYESPGRPVTAETDGFRVRQVIDGLAENALRVTPPGEQLVFALRDIPGGAEFQIRDGGPGLTPDDISVTFDRGALYARYRGSRPVGSGLGLAIVHRLVRRLTGQISVAGTSPEGGASFTVTLPRSPEAST